MDTIFTAARHNAKRFAYGKKRKRNVPAHEVFVFVRECCVIRNIKFKPRVKQPKLKDQLRAIDQEALTDPYDRALIYLANGGRIHPSAVRELFGSHSEKQRRQMISLLHKKGKTIDQLAHCLWEETNDRYTTQDYKDAVEQALQVHVSPSSAAKELIEKYDYNALYEKYAARQTG
jgi:hypothetical protein